MEDYSKERVVVDSSLTPEQQKRLFQAVEHLDKLVAEGYATKTIFAAKSISEECVCMHH